MFDRFTDRAERIMSFARQEAMRLNHPYIGAEHILLGIGHVEDGVAYQVLKELGVNRNEVRSEVERLIPRGTSTVMDGQLLLFTPCAKRILGSAGEAASDLGDGWIGTEHLLLGLISENDGIAVQALRNLGLTLEGIRSTISGFLGMSVPVQSDTTSPLTPAVNEKLARIIRNLRKVADELESLG